jgi:hypothetical protein
MPFKMKGSPLNAVGDTKDGIIKRALTGQKTNMETSSQRQSKGLYTKAELAAKSSNKDLSDNFTASLSKPGNKANNPFVNGVDTSVSKPTPSKPAPTTDKKTSTKKTLERKKEVKLDTKQIGTAPVGETTAKVDNKTTLSSNIKSVEASKLASKSKSRKEMKVDKMANKVSDAPKSRKEMRLAKTKNKAAKVKSDYNAGSKGPMEGKAARAKHDRLNKRADRIEERIAKKNKK